MTSVLLEALGVASGGVLSVGSVLMVLVVLASAGGLKKALGYYCGLFGGYALIGWLVMGISQRVRDPASSGGEPSQVGAWVMLALGAVLLSFGTRTLLERRETPEAPPKIFTMLDGMSALRLLGFGAMISAINVKNLAIYLSAVSIVIQGELPVQESMLVIVATAFVFCLVVLVPIGIFAISSEHARPLLARLRARLETHRRALSLVAMFGFGSVFFARGVLGIVG